MLGVSTQGQEQTIARVTMATTSTPKATALSPTYASSQTADVGQAHRAQTHRPAHRYAHAIPAMHTQREARLYALRPTTASLAMAGAALTPRARTLGPDNRIAIAYRVSYRRLVCRMTACCTAATIRARHKMAVADCIHTVRQQGRGPTIALAIMAITPRTGQERTAYMAY